MEDDEEFSPAIPAGVCTKKRGWAGEELEMEHRNDHAPKEDYAAVNIKQFQNTEVGTGYQARGVVRQKTSGATQSNVRDMTAKSAPADSAAERKRLEDTKATTGTANKRKKLDEYMKCEGIREFRKEIEQLLASASSTSRR